MKKAIIISCFDWYEKRLCYVKETLKKRGYTVTVIQSDFDHINKKRILNCEGYQVIHVPAYKKNLSFMRIFSHIWFAGSALKKIKSISPDLIYALIPPNFVGAVCGYYKKYNLNMKLIFDIIDMWPESMPVKRYEKLFLIHWWKGLRNKALKYADFVFTECDLYQQKLEMYLDKEKCQTLYLCSKVKAAERMEKRANQDSNTINLCYLGSINAIIDIDGIYDFLSMLQEHIKEVTLHVIGEGESRDLFIKRMEQTGCKVYYHGKIFDEFQKSEIMSECDFGINMMKDTVEVGLTIKSIDYFANGLPIINNIKGDTWKIVKEQGMGINVQKEDKECINRILQLKNKQMKTKVRKFYNSTFTEEAFWNVLESGFQKILNE